MAMAMATLHITAPVVAAAAGIYFFDRKHFSNMKELGGGRWKAVASLLTKAEDETKSSQMPRLAPQFDGLHSFETLVSSATVSSATFSTDLQCHACRSMPRDDS